MFMIEPRIMISLNLKHNMKKEKAIKLSVIISIATLICSFLTSFFFTRFLLSRPQIGDTNYGLKTTADSLTSFVSVFTFGLGTTFVRFSNKYKNNDEVESSFNIITAILSLIVVVFGVVLLILAFNNKILDVEGGKYSQKQLDDFILILITSVCYTALSIFLGNSKWLLEKNKKVVFIRLVTLFVTIGYPLVSIPFVLAGANMVIVTLIYSATYLLGFLSYMFYRIVKLKNTNILLFKKVNKSIILEIIIFSFFVVVSTASETFNHSFDKLILTIVFDASLTTAYQLSITLNQVLLSLCDIIYSPYVPFLAENYEKENFDEIETSYNKINFILLILSSLLLVGFACSGKEFVNIWLGPGKEIVYYISVLFFFIWLSYGMVKFSTTLHRLEGKHYKSSLLYLFSFLLHVGLTLVLLKPLGIWSCVLGTCGSMIFLAATFIPYNIKYLNIPQKRYLINLLKFTLISILSIVSFFLLNQFYKNYITNNILAFLVNGFLSVILYIIFFVIFFFSYVKDKVKLFFVNSYSIEKRNKPSTINNILRKIRSWKKQINSSFSIVMICYFVFNFASYLLGGIPFLASAVSSSIFIYGTKLVSYLIFLCYSILFIAANEIKINKLIYLVFGLTILSSIISAVVIPKTYTYSALNDYNWNVQTTLSIGVFDIVIGIINYVIDLFVGFNFIFIFRSNICRSDIKKFLLFVFYLSVFECFYSLIFQLSAYKSLFTGGASSGSFEGYSINISGTFLSKNGFGFLLFQGIVASVLLFIISRKQNIKYVFFIGNLLLLLVVALSLCKTAFICSLIVDILLLVLFEIDLFKSRKPFIIINSIFVGIIIACLIVSYKLSLFDKIISIFSSSSGATITSRFYIWNDAFKLLQGPFILFGYGKNIAPLFLNISSNLVTHTFHNALLDVLCSYGAIGLSLYIYAAYKLVKSSLKKENNPFLACFVVLIFVATILYGFMENVFLCLTSSCTVFTINLILSTNTDMEDGKYEEIKI